MNLDAQQTRIMVHLAATYPNGSVGWVVHYVVYSEPLEDLLTSPWGTPVIEEVIEQAIRLYHHHVGPAWSMDDFAITLWPFETPEEMFHACGARLLATDGVVRDYQSPQ